MNTLVRNCKEYTITVFATPTNVDQQTHPIPSLVVLIDPRPLPHLSVWATAPTEPIKARKHC